MAPDHRPPKALGRGLQEVGPADLLVLLGRQASDHQVARLAEQEVAVALLRQKGGAVRGAAVAACRRLKRLPEPLARVELHGPQVPDLAIVPKDHPAFDGRRAAAAIDGARRRAVPDDFGSRLILGEPVERRAISNAAGVKIIARLPRRRDRHCILRLEWLAPIELARFWIQAV